MSILALLESAFQKLSTNMHQAIAGKFIICLNSSFIIFLDILSTSPLNDTIKSTAVVNARQFYNVCIKDTFMHINNIDTIFMDVLDEIEIKFDAYAWDLSDALLKLNQYNKFVFFDVKTEIDFDSPQTREYVIQLSPASRSYDSEVDRYYGSLHPSTNTRYFWRTFRYNSYEQFEEDITPVIDFISIKYVIVFF